MRLALPVGAFPELRCRSVTSALSVTSFGKAKRPAPPNEGESAPSGPHHEPDSVQTSVIAEGAAAGCCHADDMRPVRKLVLFICRIERCVVMMHGITLRPKSQLMRA